MLNILKTKNKKKLEVMSGDEVSCRYRNEKMFSVLAPLKERTSTKICHDSHRIKYSKGIEPNYKVIHQRMVSEVFIPENCLIILDENLLHAGTESLLSGYCTSYIPRYFTYVHHKEKVADKDYTFVDMNYCDENCSFCMDERCGR